MLAINDFEIIQREFLAADEQQDVINLLARARICDGVEALAEQAEKVITRNPAKSPESFQASNQWVAVSAKKIIGYANVIFADAVNENSVNSIEAVVDPDFRRQGVGRQLVKVAADSVKGPTQIWAHGNLPGAVATAASLGLTSQRLLWQLRRGLDNLPSVDLPTGLVMRTYSEGDEGEILRVNNAAFSWHPEQGGWSLSEVTARKAEWWWDPSGLFMIFDADAPSTLLGFHWTKVHVNVVDTPDGRRGEVYIVGVDPAAQGRGLGKILTLAGLRYLASLQLTEVELYVEGDNAAALATYKNLGFMEFRVDVAFSSSS